MSTSGHSGHRLDRALERRWLMSLTHGHGLSGAGRAFASRNRPCTREVSARRRFSGTKHRPAARRSKPHVYVGFFGEAGTPARGTGIRLPAEAVGATARRLRSAVLRTKLYRLSREVAFTPGTDGASRARFYRREMRARASGTPQSAKDAMNSARSIIGC